VDTSVNTALSAQELSATRLEVDSFNKSIKAGKAGKSNLDRDDFLKLLIAQLQRSDIAFAVAVVRYRRTLD